MRRFTRLFTELDESNRTTVKVAAMEAYFREASPADAAWALWFLSGRRLRAPVKTKVLRTWIAELAQQPVWMVEECYGVVGDLAETIALLLPAGGEGTALPLHQLVEERILPLHDWGEGFQRQILTDTWNELNTAQRFVYNKLITGGFRVGVQRTLVVRALANIADVEPAVMAHRLMGTWQPRPEDFARLLAPDDGTRDPAQPYPFFLASPFEGDDPAEAFGDLEAWQAEWKWDGIRAQLIRRQGEVMLWSRGEEMVTDRFPEVAEAAARLPDGTVLDGELLAWADGAPLPFNRLQTRIQRKQVTAKHLAAAPVAFLAYDCLEADGEDLRGEPLHARRERLAALLNTLPDGLPLHLSTALEATSWGDLARLRDEARARGVEGLMLKRRDSVYQVGRPRGDWWKWKVDPHTLDAVLIYAQQGHGRRAGLYTDYTFGVWSGDDLVPVAKAYSGLTDAEIRKVDAFVKRNTLARHGPVRVVAPQLVFELAFEGIQTSTRHKAGLALRFPRMNRWRHDKAPAEANTLDDVRALLPPAATDVSRASR